MTTVRCSCQDTAPQAAAAERRAPVRRPALVRRRIAAATSPFAEPFPVPEYPPRGWFDAPTWVASWRKEAGVGPDRDERGILRLTVTDEGRVGGYFYEHGQCIVHMQDACPGPSPTRYAAFMQNDVVTDDGSSLRVGVIGNTHGHASPWVDWKDAQKHYADPTAQMLIVRAGDDERGGWIAGALVPGLTYGDVAMIRRCGLSGDWRPMPDSWWREHNVPQAAVRDAEGYDCIGPTLVTRPALPLVKSFAASVGVRAAAILGGAAGVQLAPGTRRVRVAAVTKHEAGDDFPASDFAYVPDAETPSTWKLRMTATPGGVPDAGQVGRAIAALGKGYRGNRVSIPLDARDSVKKTLRAAWGKANPDRPEDEMPGVLTASLDWLASIVAEFDARTAAAPGNPDALREWFNDGADGQIDWGEPGSFDACVAIASDHMDEEQANGFCAERHHDATGEWPGAHKAAAVASWLSARTAEWDESLHPRGEGGKFGEGGGGAKEESGRSLAERFINGESGIVLPLDQVATFTDRIAAFGKQEKENGNGTRLNLCEVSVPDTNLFCGDNQGIPRQDMPQLKGEAVRGSPADGLPKNSDGEADVTAGFLQSLRDQGIKMADDEAPAASLKATQSELVGEKVAGIAGAIRDGKIDIEHGDRIVVSKDGYILDGHHRWAGAILNDAEDGRIGDDNVMPVVRVDMGILDLVKQANDYATAEGIAQKGTTQGSVAASMAWATVTGSNDEGVKMGRTTVTLPNGIVINTTEEEMAPEARAASVSGKARKRGARVTAVVGAADLNVADQAAPWDPTAAQTNVAAWASSDGSGSPDTIDWQKYASAFFFANGDTAGPTFDAFMLPFADVVDGELQAIPDGIMAAADAVNTGAVDVPPEDVDALKQRIGAYITTMAEKFADPSIVVPWTAAPQTGMGMGDEMEGAGDMAEGIGPEGESAGLEERVAALEEQVAAMQEMMGAQVSAQVASIIESETPLPSLD